MTETIQFFDALYSCYSSGLIEIRTKKGDKSGPREWFPNCPAGYEQAEGFLSRHSLAWECYMGVLPRFGKGGDAAFLEQAGAIWTDIDAGSDTITEVSGLLRAAVSQNSLPSPNLLVRSGGGLHAYWLLSDVLPCKTQEEQARIRRVIERLIRCIGGEDGKAHACPACKDPTRILRPPGTYNLKQETPRPVQLIRHEAEKRHPLTFWESRLPAMPLPPQKKTSMKLPDGELFPATVRLIETGVPQGKRHPSMCQVAAAARHRGHDETAIRYWVEKMAQNSGVNVGTIHEQHHIDSIIEWTMAHVEVDSN